MKVKKIAIAALLYIGSKVWRSMSNGEPIDVFPLLRPFVAGFFVMNFWLVRAPVDFLIARAEGLTYGYFAKTFGSVSEQAKRVQEAVQAQARARKAEEKRRWDEKMRDKNWYEQGLEYLKEGAEYAYKGYQAVSGGFVGVISTVVAAVLLLLLYGVKSIVVWYYQYMSMIYRCILGILRANCVHGGHFSGVFQRDYQLALQVHRHLPLAGCVWDAELPHGEHPDRADLRR